jgi:hypothetical protein
MWTNVRSVVARSTPLDAVARSGFSDLDEISAGLRRVPLAGRSVTPLEENHADPSDH